MKTVLGFGEWLWDMLPSGKQMGGAPGNFAFHASQCGLKSYVVSAIGCDPLGEELLATAKKHGLQMLVARVEQPTGTVSVRLNADGVPQYQIHEDVAWDHIPITPELTQLAHQADAICFGSLAQRSTTSRQTLKHVLQLLKPEAMKVFDVNLRQQFYTPEIILSSLRYTTVLKFNDEELPIVAQMLGFSDKTPEGFFHQLQDAFGIRSLILTCGTHGSHIFSDRQHSFLPTPTVHVADTVGAGDAFTATYCAAILKGHTLREAHQLAVNLSAYVCTQSGAMPPWPQSLASKLRVENLRCS